MRLSGGPLSGHPILSTRLPGPREQTFHLYLTFMRMHHAQKNIVESSKPESAKTLDQALEKMKAKSNTAVHTRIVTACKEEAHKMEGTKEHIFQKARPRSSNPLESLLECWKSAPADKKDSCYMLIQWIRKVLLLIPLCL